MTATNTFLECIVHSYTTLEIVNMGQSGLRELNQDPDTALWEFIFQFE
jgi:hypothetical protein